MRLLCRTPGVTATAILALALAIGANTAMFSVVDAVLLRPLPFEDPGRLVMVWEDSSRVGFPRNTPAPANWVDWRSQNSVFTDIAASRSSSVNLTGDGPPERIAGRRATANFWSILGTKPVRGRTFTEAEDRTAAKVAVISWNLWQRRYGGEESVLARKILLNDEPWTVIGIMPPRFAFPTRRVEIWTPASMGAAELARRGSHYLQCFGRLKPGVTVRKAQSEMSVIAKRLERQYPDSNRELGAVVVPFRDQVAGESRTGLIVLFAASGFVLLIACANIANLLLARASGRQREIAVRSALGAGRAVIVRQLLTESLLLAALGASLGLLFARFAMTVLEKLVPSQLAAGALHLDWRMLIFTIAVTTLTGIVFGIFPALAAGRVDIQHALKQGGRTAAGAGGSWLREVLVVSQTALALALLTGAGLMLQTLDHLQNVDLGVRTDHMLTLSTNLPPTHYADHASRQRFLDAVVEKVRAIPGVTGAGYTSNLPLTTQGNTSSYVIEGQTQREADGQDALFRVVTTDFLPVIGARVREGRLFDRREVEGGAPAVIVNETFADRHFRGTSAIGKRIDISGDGGKWVTIVGVVKEIRERGIAIATKPAVYMPLAQSDGYWPVPADLAIRTAVDPASIVKPVRDAVGSVDRLQPISDIRTMDAVVDEALARQDQQTTLLSAFALLALALAATGIYGVITYAVSLRKKEIGVRMALGATPGAILRLVLTRGLGIVGLGVAAGVALALIGTRLLRSLLEGVEPQDPVTLAGAALALLLVALVACAVPARSASRVDPMVVLREE